MNKFFEYKEDKKVVTILRLRNSHKYTGKNLQHTMDSFYYLLDLFIQNNPQFEYRYYNLSIRNIKKRPRNLIDIKESDYLIIPTEMEFVYHLDTAPFILKRKTDEWIKGINEVLNDGKIRKAIILTSDKLDTIELLSTTLPSPNIEWNRIDENDFIIGGETKYGVIRKEGNPLKQRLYFTDDEHYWYEDSEIKTPCVF